MTPERGGADATVRLVVATLTSARPRAVGADAEDVYDVLGLRETVLRGGALRPLLDRVGLDLDGDAARSADQVVVVAAGLAGAEQVLALGAL